MKSANSGSVSKRSAEGLAFRRSYQFFCRPVEDADRALSVHANDASACAREHGFGESASAVDEVVRVHDVIALCPQLLRHAIKRFAELRQVSFCLAHRYAHIQ